MLTCMMIIEIIVRYLLADETIQQILCIYLLLLLLFLLFMLFIFMLLFYFYAMIMLIAV